MKKKTRAALTRARDHCLWKYRGKPSLLRACRGGADAGVDEARHAAKSLGGVTQDDAIDVAVRVRQLCPWKWKTKQYVPICEKAVDTFLEEIGKHGTSREGIIKAANATDQSCQSRYKKTQQYRQVCERVVAGFIRKLAAKRPGLEGKRRR